MKTTDSLLIGFQAWLKQYHLMHSTTRTLLAVSGGVDSVVLCDLYHRSGQKFSIAHCNFQLRGNDSDADEVFVRQLSTQYGVTCHIIQFDTLAIVESQNQSATMFIIFEARSCLIKLRRSGATPGADHAFSKIIVKRKTAALATRVIQKRNILPLRPPIQVA